MTKPEFTTVNKKNKKDTPATPDLRHKLAIFIEYNQAQKLKAPGANAAPRLKAPTLHEARQIADRRYAQRAPETTKRIHTVLDSIGALHLPSENAKTPTKGVPRINIGPQVQGPYARDQEEIGLTTLDPGTAGHEAAHVAQHGIVDPSSDGALRGKLQSEYDATRRVFDAGRGTPQTAIDLGTYLQGLSPANPYNGITNAEYMQTAFRNAAKRLRAAQGQQPAALRSKQLPFAVSDMSPEVEKRLEALIAEKNKTLPRSGHLSIYDEGAHSLLPETDQNSIRMRDAINRRLKEHRSSLIEAHERETNPFLNPGLLEHITPRERRVIDRYVRTMSGMINKNIGHGAGDLAIEEIRRALSKQ